MKRCIVRVLLVILGLQSLVFLDASASSPQLKMDDTSVLSSLDDGVVLTETEMNNLLGGEGCFGLFGSWYGSNNCCQEIKIVAAGASVATGLSAGAMWPALAFTATMYTILNCP